MPRQQTIAASVAWSHDLLDDGERALLRRLSVFAGGFTLDAAERVCSADPLDAYGVLDLLSHLVDKSLVQVVHIATVEDRYRLLETIRLYAHQRDCGESSPESCLALPHGRCNTRRRAATIRVLDEGAPAQTRE